MKSPAHHEKTVEDARAYARSLAQRKPSPPVDWRAMVSPETATIIETAMRRARQE